MKIVIIRHGDPDFKNSSLTKQGFKEVEALGKYYSDKDFDYIYSSPLIRAKLTAQAVIKNKKIIYKDFLKEFIHPFKYKNELLINWDIIPEYMNNPDFKDMYNLDTYLDNKMFKSINMKEKVNKVYKGLDEITKEYGYERVGKIYKVNKANDKTIVFFCHFGMMSVLLSRLINIPYIILAQHFCCLPTGVTTLVTEERRKGYAQFRLLHYGDITHLRKYNVKPAFSARFCERFTDKTRHE